MKIMNGLAQSMKKVIQLTQELDAAATNIRVVTNKNAEEVQSLMSSYSRLGETLGATTKEIAAAANAWLRQGYNVQATQSLI